MSRVPERPPMIRGESVYLRAAEPDDLPLFVRWLNDAAVTRHLMARAPMSMVAEEQWFTRMLEAQGKTDYHFVICLLAGGTPIGTAWASRRAPRRCSERERTTRSSRPWSSTAHRSSARTRSASSSSSVARSSHRVRCRRVRAAT